MLKALYIENIAIIEKASLDFQKGFTVLSGETGAGKSIIIDAINGIMGGRTSRELIRTGQKKAHISAIFALNDCTQLEKNGFNIDNGELLIQRDIFTDGRNNCKIGTRTVTTAQLREVCKNLITIHGQHDGAILLDEESHIDYLDAFGVDSKLLEDYLACYEELLSQNRRIKSLSMSIKQREEQTARLNALLAKLEELSPIAGEFENLKELRTRLLGAEQIDQALHFVMSAIDDDQGAGALPPLRIATEQLVKAEKYNSGLAEINGRLTASLEELEDIARSYGRVLAQGDEYAMTYEQVEQRLEAYQSLFKTTGRAENELHILLEETALALAEIEMADQDGIELLKEKYAQKRIDTLEAAARLTAAREVAAKQLKQAVEAELAYLDMKNAKLETEFLPKSDTVKFGKKGVDTLRFLLAANVGENYKPLSKVASGGELSRIMLALKTVLSQGDPVDTMIFDEVDTGVSGRAANKVGEKLWSISKEKQVICVTHLPQIAVYADNHYEVSKETVGGSTVTAVIHMNDQGRAQEIARLTGGRNITENTLRAAEEMLVLAQGFKSKE